MNIKVEDRGAWWSGELFWSAFCVFSLSLAKCCVVLWRHPAYSRANKPFGRNWNRYLRVIFPKKNKIVSLQNWSFLRCLFTWGSALPPAFFGMILQSVSPYKSNVSLHNCQEYLMGHGGRYTTNAWTNQW